MSKSIDVKVFTSDHKAFERFRFRPLTPGLVRIPVKPKRMYDVTTNRAYIPNV